MSGKITVYRGYRLRKWGDGIMVDYQRRKANPQLPRVFHWMDLTCPADLERYIDCLLSGDQAAVRHMERHHGVHEAEGPAPDLPVNGGGPVRIRMGIDWLLAIITQSEPCMLPSQAWIELRTNRNGCDPAVIRAELAKLQRVRPSPSPDEAKYYDAHAAGGLLSAGTDDWIYQGWRLRIENQQLRLVRLVPRFDGDLVSCRWLGPNEGGRYDSLRTMLNAINAGSRDAVWSAQRQRWLADVTTFDLARLPPWIHISPLRLEAILTGNDILRIPVAGLQRTPRTDHRTDVPVAWNVRLVDTQLDGWHAAAVHRTNSLAYLDLRDANQRQAECERHDRDIAFARTILGIKPPNVP